MSRASVEELVRPHRTFTASSSASATTRSPSRAFEEWRHRREQSDLEVGSRSLPGQLERALELRGGEVRQDVCQRAHPLVFVGDVVDLPKRPIEAGCKRSLFIGGKRFGELDERADPIRHVSDCARRLDGVLARPAVRAAAAGEARAD